MFAGGEDAGRTGPAADAEADPARPGRTRKGRIHQEETARSTAAAAGGAR